MSLDFGKVLPETVRIFRPFFGNKFPVLRHSVNGGALLIYFGGHPIHELADQFLSTPQQLSEASGESFGVAGATRAAEQGIVDAQYMLGLLHERRLPQPDLIRAYMWYRLSAANGHERAATRLYYLTRQLSQADIARAEDLARRRLRR